MKKRIMIVGAGVLQVPAILNAKKMGLEVVAIDMDRDAPGFEFADLNYVISTLDVENAKKLARIIKPHGVMTLASDLCMRTVASIAQDLNLNAVSMDTALHATDKGKMRNRLKENHVPIPLYFVVKNYEEYLEAVGRFAGNRFIAKPADNSGSRGVCLADSGSDLMEIYNYSRQSSRSGEVLVEEYMSGTEVSVESLTVNNQTKVVAITDKLTTGAPYFVEMGHSIPSSLSEKQKKDIRDVACAAIRAIGIDKGASHTEIMVTEQGPKIVELGARLGGDCITSHLVPLATGVNMIESCIRIALGEEPDMDRKYDKGAAIRYFSCPEGTVASIEGVEDALRMEGVHDIRVLKKPGDATTQIHGSTDRVGYVIAQAETPEDAVRICNQAMELVNITIDTK